MKHLLQTLDVAGFRLRRAAFLMLLAMMWPSLLSAEPAVLGVRVAEHLSMTRFVLDLSEKVNFEVFTLAKPYRVVIDFPEMDWRIRPNALGEGKGLIGGFRFGLFTSGTSRVVLDVKKPVAVRKVFLLNPVGQHGYRFVLDLEAVSEKNFKKSHGRTARPKSKKVALAVAPPPKNGAKPLIVLDPGHGGVDPGTHSRSGVLEKKVTLEVARKLKQRLESTGRYRVMLTRNRDIFLSLRRRVAISRAAGAALFISLHADAHRNSKTRGASVYTLSEKGSDKEAAALAAKENKADIIAALDFTDYPDPVLTNILIDMSQWQSLKSSLKFANLVIKELSKVTRLVRNTRRSAGFAVLKAPDVPSILVEMGYLSNRAEAKLLQERSHQTRLADALVKAVGHYFDGRDL